MPTRPLLRLVASTVHLKDLLKPLIAEMWLPSFLEFEALEPKVALPMVVGEV